MIWQHKRLASRLMPLLFGRWCKRLTIIDILVSLQDLQGVALRTPSSIEPPRPRVPLSLWRLTAAFELSSMRQLIRSNECPSRGALSSCRRAPPFFRTRALSLISITRSIRVVRKRWWVRAATCARVHGERSLVTGTIAETPLPSRLIITRHRLSSPLQCITCVNTASFSFSFTKSFLGDRKIHVALGDCSSSSAVRFKKPHRSAQHRRRAAGVASPLVMSRLFAMCVLCACASCARRGSGNGTRTSACAVLPFRSPPLPLPPTNRLGYLWWCWSCCWWGVSFQSASPAASLFSSS